MVNGANGERSENAVSPAEEEAKGDLVRAPTLHRNTVERLALEMQQRLKAVTRQPVHLQFTAFGATGALGARAVSPAQMEPTRDLERATSLHLSMVATLVPIVRMRVEPVTMALARHQLTVTGTLGALGESATRNVELALSRDRALATIQSQRTAAPIVPYQQT